MATNAEILTLQTQPEVNRRTDDPLFNVYYLADNITDPHLGIFAPGVEDDVLEQDETDVAEADIHKLAPIVIQKLDPNLQQFLSLGTGTVDNNIKGVLSIDMEDPVSQFEFYRRVEEVTDEVEVLDPEVNSVMRSGKKKVFLSAAPTHHEADPDVAGSFGYDDRTMLRLQSLSADGQTKTMQSFSLFDIPIKAWASFLSDRYDQEIQPTSLAIMQFCNQVILEEGSNEEIVNDFLSGVMGYLEEDDRISVERQLEAFLNEQPELKQKARAYAEEKLALEKELALSLNGWARQSVLNTVKNVYENLNPGSRALLDERFEGHNLYVDDIVALLVLKIKTVTIDNRAGLATLNERTVKRVASRIGLESTLEMASREQYIHQMLLSAPNTNSDFMVRRNEQLIAEAGVGCGGGCSVSVVDLFSSEATTALQAGLKRGTLYTSNELDNNSKCSCGVKHGKKAKVISDGRNVVCVTCGTYQVRGRRGQLKEAA
ncbi:MAG TPA: hypothetical protein VGF75_00060 [Candidatus Saccharimonadales bacterium]